MVRLQAATPTFNGASVYDAATQSIPNSAWTLLTYSAEHYDTSNYHSTAVNTSRLVAPVTGYYLCRASANFAASGTGYRALAICKNSAGVAGTSFGGDFRPAATGTITLLNVSTTLYLVAGDYLEVFVNQNSGGALAVTKTGEAPFQMTLVGT
jgi:hypothetical protein